MMTLIEKKVENDKETFSQVSFDSWEDAQLHVARLFYADLKDLVCFDERRFHNGAKSLSMRDKQNKIIYQLKTV
jgi:hypothetical protein